MNERKNNNSMKISRKIELVTKCILSQKNYDSENFQVNLSTQISCNGDTRFFEQKIMVELIIIYNPDSLSCGLVVMISAYGVMGCEFKLHFYVSSEI